VPVAWSDRISNTVGSTTTDYYNSDEGQVLEESSGGIYTTPAERQAAP
jgi:hypothetical protein